MFDERYRRDIERSIYISSLRKKQAASFPVPRKVYALGKKAVLAGMGWEFPELAISGWA